MNASGRSAIALALGALALALPHGARAGVCDYAPSHLLGKGARAVGGAIAGTGAAVGVGLQAVGYYTLVHGTSGLTSAAGAAAADTAGLVAGASGLLGTAGAFLTAPATIVVGGITLIGAGAFEGACYFRVARVTDPYDVRRIVESVATRDDTIAIVSTKDGDAMTLTAGEKTSTYLLRNLYVADGNLMYRDFGPNTNLGPIVFTAESPQE